MCIAILGIPCENTVGKEYVVTSRDIAVTRLGFAAPTVKVSRSLYFYIPALFVGIFLGVIFTLLSIPILKKGSIFIAEAQGYNFMHTAQSSDEPNAPQLIGFTLTSKQLKIEEGGEVDMYIARMRRISTNEVDGVKKKHIVDTLLTLGLIDVNEVDQGYEDIPLQEWLDDHGMLQASTGAVQ